MKQTKPTNPKSSATPVACGLGGQATVVELNDDVTNGGVVLNVRHTNVPKNGIEGVLVVINSALNTLSPPLGTVREFPHRERELCKLGLKLLKLGFNSAKSL